MAITKMIQLVNNIKNIDIKMRLRERERERERERGQTPEHGAHHHEPPEKLDPSNPRYHLHRPNQFFSQP